jgi:hypothetical protein
LCKVKTCDFYSLTVLHSSINPIRRRWNVSKPAFGVRAFHPMRVGSARPWPHRLSTSTLMARCMMTMQRDKDNSMRPISLIFLFIKNRYIGYQRQYAVVMTNILCLFIVHTINFENSWVSKSLYTQSIHPSNPMSSRKQIKYQSESKI